MRMIRRGAVRFRTIEYADVVLARYEGRALEVRLGPNGDAEVEIYDGDQRIATAAARTRPTPKPPPPPPPGIGTTNGPDPACEVDHKPVISIMFGAEGVGTVIVGAEGVGKACAVVLPPGSCYVELTFGPGRTTRLRCDRPDLNRWTC